MSEAQGSAAHPGPSAKGGATSDGAAGPAEAHAADPWDVLGTTWSASMDAMTAWSRTLQSAFDTRGRPAAALMAGAFAAPAQWPETLSPLLDEMRRGLALPVFADLPRMEAALLPDAAAPVEAAMLLQQYLVTMTPVWVKACEEFQAEVERRRAADPDHDALADGMDIWNTVLGRTLMAFNRTDAFGDLQKRVLHAAMRQRQDTRRRAEMVAEAIDMPTRTEMRDVYKRLHGLMREVHGLRREVRALRAQRTPANGAAAPADGDASGG